MYRYRLLPSLACVLLVLICALGLWRWSASAAHGLPLGGVVLPFRQDGTSGVCVVSRPATLWAPVLHLSTPGVAVLPATVVGTPISATLPATSGNAPVAGAGTIPPHQ